MKWLGDFDLVFVGRPLKNKAAKKTKVSVPAPKKPAKTVKKEAPAKGTPAKAAKSVKEKAPAKTAKATKKK